jgi:DNA-binding CsgD family transcriptional regulator
MLATGALLERESEIAAIERRLDASRAGVGGLLIVEGPAGAGKTSLLDACGELAAERGIRGLLARGGEFERDFPYGVVRQLFEPLLADDAARDRLLNGSAAMALPVFEPRTANSDSSEPFAIQHGLYWLLADIAAETPLLLQVDDAQWADLASLQALAYLGRRLADLPVALALTTRTGEAGGHEELLDELRREPATCLIEPRPLSTSATAALIAGETGEPANDRFAAACREATAGNPFLLVELLRSLDQERTDPDSADADRLAEVAATGASRSILTRLARLGERSTAVARAVAVLEPNADPGPVAELSDLPQTVVAEECAQLVRSQLLSDSRPVGFVHPLVRAAVLSDVPSPKLAAVHARAAQVLDRNGAAIDAVAAHLLLAEPAGDLWAVSVLSSAAAEAIGRGAPDAAVRYLRRALREPPPAEDRLAVSRELGLALLRADDPEGIGVLRTVRGATTDAAARAELATELASSLGLRGGCAEAAALLEDSLAEVPAGELATFLKGWLLLQVVWGLERMPDGVLPKPGEEPGTKTLAGRYFLGQTAGLLASELGSVERAAELARQVLADRDAVVEDALAGLPPQGAMLALILADHGDEVAELMNVVIEASRRRGALPGIAVDLSVRGFGHMADGDLRDAEADAEIVVDIGNRLELPGGRATWTGFAVRIAALRGDVARGEALLAGALGSLGTASGIPSAILLCSRGELRRVSGRHAEARHAFLAAAERIEWLPDANPELFPWRPGLALCESALGNGERACELAAEGTRAARRAGGRRGIGIALGVEGTVTGGSEGAELLRESVDTLATTRVGLERARALVELGANLRRANHRKDAREPLRQGLELAHRCGAPPLEERARTELAATGARPRKAVFTGVESLTPSELRVARMAADGMTNREIAQELTVTEKTVETHMRHVFQKLDVSRRTGLPAVLSVVG